MLSPLQVLSSLLAGLPTSHKKERVTYLKIPPGKESACCLSNQCGALLGVLLGSSLGLTYFRPDVTQSPLLLCWTPKGGEDDRRIPHGHTLPPLPCSVRYSRDGEREGKEKRKRMTRRGWRTTAGPLTQKRRLSEFAHLVPSAFPSTDHSVPRPNSFRNPASPMAA